MKKLKLKEDLSQLIKEGNFSYADKNITEKNFPLKEVRGEVKIFYFGRFISSENAIKEMEKEGYEPANVYELLEYAKCVCNVKDWDGKNWVIALGQIWDDLDGRSVACLWGYSGYRRLDLLRFDGDWRAYYRFLAVRQVAKPLETKKLGDSSVTLNSLELRISELEEFKSKVEKMLII